MPQSTRFTIVDTDDFQLDVEYNETFLILHLPRLRPTPGVIKALKVKLEELEEFAYASSWIMLFTAIHPDDKAMRKLMKIIGAEYTGTAEGLDVYRYEEER